VLPPVLSEKHFYMPRLGGFEDDSAGLGVRKACSDLDSCPAFPSLFEGCSFSKNDGNASGSSPRSKAPQMAAAFGSRTRRAARSAPET
jgi:hypothetical protein